MGHSQQYLLTADLGQLMRQWAERHCYLLPSHDFFHSLDERTRLAVQQAVGPTVATRMLPIETLIDGIRRLIKEHAADLPIVMMDHAVQSAVDKRQVFHYSATRLIQWDPKANTWCRHKTEGPRPNQPPLADQCRFIAAALTSQQHVVIVDDGCYDGESLQHCADELAKAGLKVAMAIVGIQRVKQEALKKDFPVYPVVTFDESQLADWVCERDFVLGVPDSGRAIQFSGRSDKEYCAPYLFGFGDVHDWASLPEEVVVEFTTTMLEISRDLYLAIGAASGRPVLASDIDRWPFYNGAPMEVNESGEFVACIEDVLTGMKKITT